MSLLLLLLGLVFGNINFNHAMLNGDIRVLIDNYGHQLLLYPVLLALAMLLWIVDGYRLVFNISVLIDKKSGTLFCLAFILLLTAFALERNVFYALSSTQFM